MATYTFKDCYFTLGGVNLSTYIRSLSLTDGPSMIENHTMGDDTMSARAGYQEWSLSITMLQDFASGGPDATIAGLGNDRSGAIVLRPTSAAKSATNPEWTGTAVWNKYTPMQGAPNALGECSLELESASALARATS